MARLKGWYQLITAKSALNEAGVLSHPEVGGAGYTTFYVVFGAGTSAGVVLIETSHSDSYAGAGGWALLGTVTWSAAEKVHSVSVVGGFRNLRARISTAIVGGTVDVYANISE